MSNQTSAKLALSAEQWARLPSDYTTRHPIGLLVVMGDTRNESHALAALCLYGQPFGFTHEDIAAIERTMRHDDDGDDVARVTSCVARIAALLPPATP